MYYNIMHNLCPQPKFTWSAMSLSPQRFRFTEWVFNKQFISRVSSSIQFTNQPTFAIVSLLTDGRTFLLKVFNRNHPCVNSSFFVRPFHIHLANPIKEIVMRDTTMTHFFMIVHLSLSIYHRDEGKNRNLSFYCIANYIFILI